MTTKIPELSFNQIERGDTSSVSSLDSALRDHGFFSIIDHGLNKKLIESCYIASQEVFNLDFAIKNSYSASASKGARGYTPNGIETAVGETIADQKEFWHHGPNVDDSYNAKIPRNIKISELPEFNHCFDKLFLELNEIGIRILSVIALSLNLEKNFFKPWVEKGNSLLRAIHYPPVESSKNLYRARAHEDINLITLLIGAEEGGLEVLSKDNTWIKVNPSSDAIVCNIGDMMQLVTDSRLKSTTHRVIQDNNLKSKSRYSIPFFMHPSPDTLLKSVFRNNDMGVLADDFLDERLKAIKLY